MNTNFFRKLWCKLANNEDYRKHFVAAQAKQAFAFQLRAIMKKRGISQETLAEQSGLTQGVISRAADPKYGTLTTTVKVKIANGLDMAYMGILVPHSEMAKWFCNLSEESVQVETFEEENKGFHSGDEEVVLSAEAGYGLSGTKNNLLIMPKINPMANELSNGEQDEGSVNSFSTGTSVRRNRRTEQERKGVFAGFGASPSEQVSVFEISKQA